MSATSGDRQRKRDRLAAAALALALALPIVALAAPRFVAALSEIPGNAALRVLQERAEVPDADLRTLVATREAALAWSRSPRSHSDLALARLVLADRDPDPAAQDRHIAAAIVDLEASIAAAPANPYAWVRLALARARTGAPADDVAAAAIASVLTGPHEPQIVTPRLRLLLDRWHVLDGHGRDLVRAQTHYAMRVRAADLLALAGDPRRRSLIRRALAREPQLLFRFDRRYSAAYSASGAR